MGYYGMGFRIWALEGLGFVTFRAGRACRKKT